MSNELYHWGVKGMKWGVRRYQNYDGTLTNAGRRRLGLSEKPDTIFNDYKRPKTPEEKKIEENLNPSKIRRFAYQQAAADDKAASEGLNAAGSGSKTASRMAAKKAEKKRRKYAESINVSEMSDQDLQKAVNRMNLEQNYKRLKSGNIQTGSDKVAEYLDTAGDIAAVGASLASIMLAIHTLKG